MPSVEWPFTHGNVTKINGGSGLRPLPSSSPRA